VLHFLRELHEPDSWRLVFNLFGYVTFRAALAASTAFVVSVLVGPWVIRRLRKMKVLEKTEKGDSAQLDEMHRDKATTPTMGGLLMLPTIVVSAALWGKLVDFVPVNGNGSELRVNWLLLGAVLTYAVLAAVGFIDDRIKMTTPGSKGMSIGRKMLALVVVGGVIAVWLAAFGDPAYSTRLQLPFIKPSVWFPELGILFVVWVLTVVVGTTNAVNITDGLDGLAAGCVTMVALSYAALAYLASHFKMASYLQIQWVPGSEELVIFCAAVAGATLGFLWYNAHPAEVFMGDVGALPLGGAIGYTALAVKQELLLVVVGGIFVMEAGSVLMQIASFRFFGRRVFRIAPLHHHFQFAGWSESKIVVRFWIMAAIFALLSIASLKIR